MPFATGPQLRYVGLGQYATIGPTVYVGADDILTIPADFTTDLATVPRVFWALLPPHGAYERAAVLHDACCTWLAEERRGGPPAPVNARDSDGLFRRVMRECGVGFLTRWVMFVGVRYGALANPARRAGWWRDLPAVAGVSLAVLVATALAVYGLDALAHTILGGARP